MAPKRIELESWGSTQVKALEKIFSTAMKFLGFFSEIVFKIRNEKCITRLILWFWEEIC